MRESFSMQDKQSTAGSSTKTQDLVLGLWGVRYQVKDVQRSIAFYTQTLGFNLDQQNLPAFAQVSIDNLKLILSGPGASGSRPMPYGRQQEPGGWNRIVLLVKDLPTSIAHLKNQGVHFRNEMEVGPGGRQIQVEDPDGNPIELFEPARATTL
jgi:glyoxylase I family protein